MIVKSRKRQDPVTNLREFFERLRQFKMRLNPKKCCRILAFNSRWFPTTWEDEGEMGLPDEDILVLEDAPWRMYFAFFK